MCSLIRKPNEIVVNPKIKALIYGQAGTGKSSLALSSVKPLLIDCDNGVHRVNVAHRTDTLQVASYEEVLGVLNGEDLSAYETIVIDTGGKLLDFMAAYIIGRNSKMGRSNGALTLQGYGERKQEFGAFCKLVASKNKHLVFVAHRETKTEGDDTRYVPLFGGSNYDALVTELDMVGYMEMNGTKRTITFNPTSRNDGKNTCNLPPAMELPVAVDADGTGKPYTFLAVEVIGKYLANIQRSEVLNQEYHAVMDEIRQNIELIASQEDANSFIGRIDAFAHVGSSKAMAGRMLNDKAKSLGLSLNKATKLYEKAV